RRSPVFSEMLNFLGRQPFELKDLPAAATPAAVSSQGGTAVLPFDAVTLPTLAPKPAPFTLDFDTVNGKKNAMPTTRFVGGDELLIFVKPTKDINVEIVWTSGDGTRNIIANKKNSRIKADNIGTYLGSDQGGYELANEPAKEFLTIYASEKPLPPG